MSFQGLTPESLLSRSDSKNPATTCKGLTSSGRPCRRGLGSTPGSSPSTTPTKTAYRKDGRNEVKDAGVVAIIDSTNAAAFFCWQHKDQAQNLIAKIERLQQQHDQGTRVIPLQKRSSIDTLVERVGVIDLDGDGENGQSGSDRPVFQGKKAGNARTRKRDTLPPEWRGIQGPLMSVPEEVVDEVIPRPPTQRRRSMSKPRPSQTQSWQQRAEKAPRPKPKSSWCCGLGDDGYNDDGPPARRRQRYEDHRRPSRSRSRPRPSTSNTRPASHREGPSHDRPHTQARLPPMHDGRPQTTPTRPRPAPNPMQTTSTPPHSQTSYFLSLIPPHLDPTTTSSLLSELSKPFAKDDDAGYIYIYWLTPSSKPGNNNTDDDDDDRDDDDRPDDDIASTILDSDSDSDNHDSYRATTRRRTAALTRYASAPHHPNRNTNTPTRPTILLKIGRATNVHRRMAQWSKQCGQNITLVRYYPRPRPRPHSGSSVDANAKVPHVNRVERLIHVELRGTGLGAQPAACGACGRGHREWFEVEATRAALRDVDAVVRRWVGWAEAVGRREIHRP